MANEIPSASNQIFKQRGDGIHARPTIAADYLGIENRTLTLPLPLGIGLGAFGRFLEIQTPESPKSPSSNGK
jgi:hypothetical protein